jgi:hypothetical protein
MSKKKTVLKVIPYLLATQMAVPSQIVHADPIAPGVGIIAGAAKGDTLITSGDTTIQKIDTSAILEKVLGQTGAIGQQNLEVVTSYVNSLQTRIEALIENHFSADMAYNSTLPDSPTNLFALSIASGRIGVQSYLIAKQEFLNDKQEIQLLIDSVKGITGAVQGSTDKVEADLGIKGLAASMPQPLKNILIELAVTPAEKNLEILQKRAEAMKFTVDVYGQVKSVDGLSLDSKDVKISQQERDTIQADIDFRASGFKNEQKVKLINYNVAIRQKINSIMATALKEGYRLSDPKFWNEVADSLDEIMFTRSYLRVTYGYPMGGLLIKHSTSNFYKEWLTTPSTITWESTVVFSYNDKESVLRDMRAGLSTASARAIDYETWKKSESVMWQAVSGISSVASFMKGTKDQERFKAAILGLIIADFEEETMVTRPGGLKLLKDRFELRYTSSDEKIAKYEPMLTRIEGSVDHVSGTVAVNSDEASGFEDSNSDVMSEDAQGMLPMVIGILNSKQIDSEIARKNRQFLASLAADESTRVDQVNRKKTIRGSFGKKKN